MAHLSSIIFNVVVVVFSFLSNFIYTLHIFTYGIFVFNYKSMCTFENKITHASFRERIWKYNSNVHWWKLRTTLDQLPHPPIVYSRYIGSYRINSKQGCVYAKWRAPRLWPISKNGPLFLYWVKWPNEFRKTAQQNIEGSDLVRGNLIGGNFPFSLVVQDQYEPRSMNYAKTQIRRKWVKPMEKLAGMCEGWGSAKYRCSENGCN